MGGLVVKEMLMQERLRRESIGQKGTLIRAGIHEDQKGIQKDQNKASILENVKGVVFFATPHFGSSLADFCKHYLSQVPGFTPSPSFEKLAPGPHLSELNDAMRSIAEGRGGKVGKGEGEGLIVVNILEGITTEFM